MKAAYKRPESVLIVVHTPALECLLLERAEPAGFWQSVTGSLGWNETPAAAAARELFEETGLDSAGLVDAGVERRFAIAPAWRHRYAPDVTENLEHWWTLELPTPRSITLDRREHRRFLWARFEEAIETVNSWTNKEAIERLRPVDRA